MENKTTFKEIMSGLIEFSETTAKEKKGTLKQLYSQYRQEVYKGLLENIPDANDLEIQKTNQERVFEPLFVALDKVKEKMGLEKNDSSDDSDYSPEEILAKSMLTRSEMTSLVNTTRGCLFGAHQQLKINDRKASA